MKNLPREWHEADTNGKIAFLKKYRPDLIKEIKEQHAKTKDPIIAAKNFCESLGIDYDENEFDENAAEKFLSNFYG